MIRILIVFVVLFNISKTFGQECVEKEMVPLTEFESKTQFANYEIGWYDEWLEHTGGKKILPKPLKPQPKWIHPYMKVGYTAAMHEGPRSSDVSNQAGPRLENLKAQYFHVLQKGGDFSGMCPTFAFINDSTVASLSFGRANTTLLLLDVKDTVKVLDQMPIPGRENSMLELAGKKGRAKIFSNTAGGAYSYLSDANNIYIPGANNNILKVSIKDRKFENRHITSLDLGLQIEAGDLEDKEQYKKKERDNKLTAIMPDVDGNIWFTSRRGVIGLIHREDESSAGCPMIYSTHVAYFGLEEKIKRYYPESVDKLDQLSHFIEVDSVSPEARKETREVLGADSDLHEEIQNSFSVGKNGVYIVSNMALYKLRFNNQTKEIELDPKWEKAFGKGDLVYTNDLVKRPGHLNAGSGTTPTLMDDRFVAICDNAEGKINLCVFSQETGELVSKNPLFTEQGSAVENSAVAYEDSFIVANTYGYTDPFEVNPTPGGIMRFDLDKNEGEFKEAKDWPAGDLYDCKTATPKLSTKSGMLYVYNRSEEEVDGHKDWQITGIDFRTGLRVLYAKFFFEQGEFQDNISEVLKMGSLGTKNYDRKVFNNIWGTFTFGPGNSFYIGVYRGFLKISSD